MSKKPAAGKRKFLLTLAAIFFVGAMIAIPRFSKTHAVSGVNGPDETARTVSHADDLPNYDIRSDKSAYEKIAAFRGSQNKDAASLADLRDSFARGEEDLRQRVPTLKVEYNLDIRTAEVIAPDVKQGRAVLSGATGANRSDTLKNFLRENSALIGAGAQQIDDLKVFADYMNPAGNMGFVELNQEINGIPVFRGEVKAGFTPSGEMFRVINNIAPGLDAASLTSDFGDPAKAVRAASGYIKHNFDISREPLNNAVSTDQRAVFGEGDQATTAEKMYFPTEAGVAVPAWRVLIWEPVAAYYVIVDAGSGTMLWRKNIAEDQTQSATYHVYVNPNAMVNIADNPFPMTPGPTTLSGVQGTAIPRTGITRIGNEAPYTFNNLGWITDGNNTTDGNNVQAGLDRELPNTGSPANPADIDPTGMATGSPNRVFNFTYQPGIPTNPAQNTGDAPLPAGQTPTGCLAQGTNSVPTAFQSGIVTNLFYIMNVYHDEMYTLGFNEAARNFQTDNFGRGGVGNDRVSAQAQDCSGTNNANFRTPADGTRGAMQMYLWTSPAPDFDGSLDADVIIHEATHGLSNRLHGNSSGLVLDFARGMGEGWSDFYGHCMLSEGSDPVNGIYTTGAYDTYRFSTVGFNNYYYGIRRFPKAVMSFTGGPNNRPHNPLTFADIDSTQINLSDGAFSPAFNSTADQVHNIGEVWSSALWEVRARMIQRLGWATGNRRVLQMVTDGMKLAPLNPTFLTERDAIIAGAQATGTAADVSDIWNGFAIRGIGASASVQNVGGQSSGGLGTIRVTQAFDLPNLVQSPAITVSDAPGDNDGSVEPGEPIAISVPLTNNTGTSATAVTLQMVGGPSANYGTINNGQTVSRTLNYTVPSGTPCGSTLNFTFNVNSSLGAKSFSGSTIVGAPIVSLAQNFDSVTAPSLPAGWTVGTEAGGTAFVNTTTGPDTAPNSMFAADPASVGGATSLTSPSIAIASAAATVTFRNKYNTEDGWDGGVLEISLGGGAFTDIVTAGGSFIAGGYNGPLGAGANNPLANRNAWSGNSGGYITTTAKLPASANGQNVQLRWRFGADDNTSVVGWNVDTISVTGSYTCSYTPGGDSRVRADFDGDGKTDPSVFRPSEGNWYLNRSTQGFTAVQWGQNGDQLVPADYDNDGKTDLAIFRPSNAPNSTFYVLRSSDMTFYNFGWGQTGDVPVVGDYDGDGLADAAVYRPSNNTWFVKKAAGGFTSQSFGQAGDVPVPGDYDGDGKNDLAIFRNGTWYVLKTSGIYTVQPWGQAGDKPVPADYDGDGKDDLAVWRESDGKWYIFRSTDGTFYSVSWGQTGDVPVPGDYDGDGKYDPAIYRNGAWYLARSTGGTTTVNWGVAGDIPVPAKYIP